MTSTSPIEAALRKVRELRDVERKMTPGPWNIETPMGDEIPWIVQDASKPAYEWECLAMFSGDGPITAKQGMDNAEGSAALRNAAPTLLDLLEALLQREYVASDTGIDVERDARKKIAAKKINKALAAFVEGTDAA